MVGERRLVGIGGYSPCPLVHIFIYIHLVLLLARLDELGCFKSSQIKFKQTISYAEMKAHRMYSKNLV